MLLVRTADSRGVFRFVMAGVNTIIMLVHCWFDVGILTTTLAQHQSNSTLALRGSWCFGFLIGASNNMINGWKIFCTYTSLFQPISAFMMVQLL